MTLKEYIEKEEFNKLKDDVNKSIFFGIPLSEMSKEELLVVIGYLNNEVNKINDKTDSLLNKLQYLI